MDTEKDVENQDGDGGGHDRPPGCDPQEGADIECSMAGIDAQSTYNASLKEKFASSKTDFEKTRKDYRSKRHEAQLKVQEMRHRIRQMLERIRCKIEQERVIREIDRAFAEIVEELSTCDRKRSFCSDADCDFDLESGDLAYDKLVRRIQKYQQRADEAWAYFTELVAEPANLELRIATAKGKLDAIDADLAAEPAITDLKTVYAKALVAQRDLDGIWKGFDEVTDFVDCLCRALNCWTSGSRAVSKLTGDKAVLDCKRKTKHDHCGKLQNNTVDEILRIYDKLSCDDRKGIKGRNDAGEHSAPDVSSDSVTER